MDNSIISDTLRSIKYLSTSRETAPFFSKMGSAYFLIALGLLAYVANPAVAIVGGKEALPGQFPFQVSIRNDGFGHICGGFIASPNLVITAGACTDPRTPPITAIVAGSLRRNETVPWQQLRTAARIVNHPGYNGTTMDNDLALLFLNEPFIFNENISSLRLPPAFIETAPKPIILAGWGNIQYGESLFDNLMHVTVDTYVDKDCEERVGQYVRPEILCIGADEGGRGGCQGDAGSALIIPGNNTYATSVYSHFPCPLPDCKYLC